MAERIYIDEDFVEEKVQTLEWGDLKLEVKYNLPIADAMGFVDDVVASCFQDGEYYPEALDIARRRETVLRYANVTLPEDIASLYKILYFTDLYNQIYELVDWDQLDTLWTDINVRIDMIRNDRRAAVEKQMADMYAMMKSLSDVLGETVGDVTGEQVTEFMKALANNQIDEGKIVSALLDEKKKKEVKVS